MFKEFDNLFAKKVLNQTQWNLQKKAHNLCDNLAQKKILQISKNIEVCRDKKIYYRTNFKFLSKYKAHLVVPTPQSASTALGDIFQEQEKVNVPWKGEVDHAILNNNSFSILKNLLRNSLKGNKNIIVQHGYVSGTGSPVNCLPILKKLCRRDFFIHSVRSPLENLLSAINNELIQISGAGYFPSVIENSVFNGQIYDGKEIEIQIKREFKKNLLKDSLMQKCYDKVKSQIRHFKIGSIYKENFGDWVPIDICHKNESFLQDDVKKINRLLKLNINYKSLLEQNSASRYVSYFGKNKTRVSMGSFISPPMGLGAPHLCFNKSLFGEAELVWLDQKYKVPFFNYETNLCITVDSKEFLKMSEDNKRKLLDKENLQKAFEKIYPRWFFEAEICHRIQKNLKAEINYLKQDQKNYDELVNDTVQFCEVHPSFFLRWGLSNLF